MLLGKILQKTGKYRYVVQAQSMGTAVTVQCWCLSTKDVFEVGDFCSVLTHASDPNQNAYVITRGEWLGHGEIVASPLSLSSWNWLRNRLLLGHVQVSKPKYWFGIIESMSEDRRRANVQLYGSGNFGETARVKIFPFNKRVWTDVPIKYQGDSSFYSFEPGDNVVLDFKFSNSPELIGFAQEPRVRDVIAKVFYQHVIPVNWFKQNSGVIDDKIKYDKKGNVIERDPLDGNFYAFAPINYGYPYRGSSKIYDYQSSIVEMSASGKRYSWSSDRVMESSARYSRTLLPESFLLGAGMNNNNVEEYFIWKRDGTYEKRYLSRSFNTVFGNDFETNYGSDYKTGVRYNAKPFIDSFPELKEYYDTCDVVFYHRGVGRILGDIRGWFNVDKYSPMLNLEGYLIKKQES